MSDGVTVQGNVFISIDGRVLGLMNNSAATFPEDGSVHLLNKFEILRLMPLGSKR